MSRIHTLIGEMCPDGVEFKRLGNLGVWRGGGTPSKHNPAYWEDGTIPWLSPKDMGRFVLDGTIDKISTAALRATPVKLIPANSVAVVVRSSILDKAFPVALVPFATTLNQDMKALVPHDGVMAAYIAHTLTSFGDAVLRACRKTGGSVASIEVPKLLNFLVPIPPLRIQREVVKVLDSFTELESELETELKAELETRRRQYKYYRNALLTFADDVCASEASKQASKQASVRWTTLSEIAKTVTSGGTPLSTRPDYYRGNIPWLRTQEVRFMDIRDTEVKITEQGLAGSSARWIPANCVIVAISGATAGRCAINKIPLTTNQHCCNFEIDPVKAIYRYVFHWVSREYEKLKALGQGARADLNAGIIKKVPIPVPSLEEQARIVAILDHFDALVNDLSIDLPAELKARRQQYEYYRDRLLTFREAA